MCAVKLVSEKKAKKVIKQVKDNVKIEKKKNAIQKREFYDNDTKTRKKAAKLACHAYIRARDWGEPCICCDRPFQDNNQAGHWLESGNNPRIMFDEDNINGQTMYCNVYKGGDDGNYENNLVLKIGQKRVDRLKSLKGASKVKMTAQDYKKIEDYYKRKLKELNEELS